MSPSIGLNLRVTGHCNQGGRKYMEDVFSVAYQQTEDELDLEYAFFGIFDGHGGKEAALFAKEHLMDNITKHPNFWSENDDLVLKAIREGFLKTQQDMWGDLENWTKTGSGLPSTAGTTASIAFIRRGKIFIGHVGDSGIVLGEQDEDCPDVWVPRSLTRDHKPECERELARIEAAGGKVISKSGVPRVVWNRPRIGHTGPVRRSTHIDEVPFLAVARALGDLWSYNSKKDVFVVSPEPDLHVYSVDISKHRCLILGTDGAWNVLSPEAAVNAVKIAEKNNEKHMLDPEAGHTWQNPSKRLVDMAVEKWNAYKLRADNTSVVVVMLDPPGPPRAQVLRRQRELASQPASGPVAKKPCNNEGAPPLPPKPCKTSKGLAIISRFPNSKKPEEAEGKNLVSHGGSSDEPMAAEGSSSPASGRSSSRIVHDSTKTEPQKVKVSPVPTSHLPPVQTLQPKTVTADPLSPDAFVTRVPGTKHSPARQSLSRELASLQLQTPPPPAGRASRRSTANEPACRRSAAAKTCRRSGSNSSSSSSRPVLKPKRRGHSLGGVAGRHDESDTENIRDEDEEEEGQQLVPSYKLAEVEKKCEDLTNKIKEMEKKMSSQTKLLSMEVRALRSTLERADSPATPRVLRSKNCNEVTGTPASGIKRKRAEGLAAVSMPVKRERTVTWAGKSRPLVAAQSLPNGGGRPVRKSTGGGGGGIILTGSPPTTSPLGRKLKRNRITLKRK